MLGLISAEVAWLNNNTITKEATFNKTGFAGVYERSNGGYSGNDSILTIKKFI